MDKKGISVTKMLTGFSTAEKQAAKDHISLADELKKMAAEIDAMPSKAEKDAKAFELFGSRNWTQAKVALDDYFSILNQLPDAFYASSSSLDTFLASNASLENKLKR